MGGIGGMFERASWDQCRLLGAWLGLVLYGALGKKREAAANNVRLALGVSPARANQLARRSCMNFGMTFAEFMHLKSASPEEVRRTCYINGLEHIQKSIGEGNGTILLTGHLGNWELMGARASQDFPLTVVARPTSNSGVQAHIDAARRAGGLEIISKFETGRASIKVLKDNGVLGILPDQHAGADGLLLPMFGQPTRMIGGLARLAMLSGATVIPAFGIRRRPWLADGRIVATVSPGWHVVKSADREAAVLEGTRRVIAELEAVVRANPDQWLWLHRRWRREDGAVFPGDRVKAEAAAS
jgi:KDO2-lipid IV(A) lauroyltransferase